MPLFLTNKDLDSTVMLFGFLLLSGLLMILGFINPEFGKSQVSQSFAKIFEMSWPLLLGYFFGKSQSQNGSNNVQVPGPGGNTK